MTLLFAVLLAYSAMVALCMGLERHHKKVWNKQPSALLLHGLRWTGWSLLVASFWVCARGWGWAMGPVGWFGMVSLAGLGLAFSLPYRPQQAAWLALGGPLLGGVLQLFIRS